MYCLPSCFPHCLCIILGNQNIRKDDPPNTSLACPCLDLLSSTFFSNALCHPAMPLPIISICVTFTSWFQMFAFDSPVSDFSNFHFYTTVHHNHQVMHWSYLAFTVSWLSSLSKLCFFALSTVITLLWASLTSLPFWIGGHTHLWKYCCFRISVPCRGCTHAGECCWIKISETCWMDSHQVYDHWSQIGSRPWGYTTPFL